MAEQPDLAVSARELEPVRTAASALYEDLTARGPAAVPETQAAAGDFDQVQLKAGWALAELARGWQRQCAELQRDTARISGHLDGTVRTFADTESAISSSVLRIAEGPAGADGIEANQDVLRLFGLAGNGEGSGGGAGGGGH
ncbi:hypothetical protein RM780_16920 [Streptomyces sp. DSM 44917]|uniref:PE domain-containing protein n=1 Tax=Streptomyces boetiae TaxID=3075541 RepID=A0ABU2LAP2_9ACTN|nr:hypothetical protein [Streptomyces sp. DSM 44917]MDT0308629.1 hypothetical protein [Streptomyces sp. DSM 44917]